MAPTITSLTDTSSGTNQGKVGDTVNIVGTGFSTPLKVNGFGGSSLFATVTSSTAAHFVIPSSAPCCGQVPVSVTVTSGQTSNEQPFFVICAPTTTAVSPTCLPLAGGTATLYGTNFAVGGQVQLNGANAVALPGGNNTSATVTLPAQAAGTYAVTASTAGGTGSSGITYVTYQAAPTVTGTTGPGGTNTGTGQDPITISGTNLGNLVSVQYFDGTNTITDPTAASQTATLVNSTVPTGLTPTATGSIIVTTCGGSVTFTPFVIT
jgi:IPT/TIG domain